MVGNFPQAFSHLTFIGAAHALAEAEAKGAASPGGQLP
jgi:GH15 family glucan-1,4-alpha-glucosidase